MTTAANPKPSVLFVDDERRVLTSMRALFRRDYNVFLANSGQEALAIMEQEDLDVIVSDQRMPGMTGVAVLKAFKTNAPRAMRILLTGYADTDAIEASINEGEVFRYLQKPCPREVLKETVSLAARAATVAHRTPAAAGPDDDTAGVEEIEMGLPPAPFGGAAEATESAALESARLEKVPLRPVSTKDVELLVLSNDTKLIQALDHALEQSHTLHAVDALDQAVEVLEQHAIGVLITDIAINADEVQALTSQLKQHVPELVTIVASDHSDAHRLIDLINGGQVFRFLLKPIKAKQTSIWIESAIGKHLQLMRNPQLAARHVVANPPKTIKRLGDQMKRAMGRIMRLRRRAEAT